MVIEPTSKSVACDSYILFIQQQDASIRYLPNM